jgi:hypothetical protein
VMAHERICFLCPEAARTPPRWAMRRNDSYAHYLTTCHIAKNLSFWRETFLCLLLFCKARRPLLALSACLPACLPSACLPACLPPAREELN